MHSKNSYIPETNEFQLKEIKDTTSESEKEKGEGVEIEKGFELDKISKSIGEVILPFIIPNKPLSSILSLAQTSTSP